MRAMATSRLADPGSGIGRLEIGPGRSIDNPLRFQHIRSHSETIGGRDGPAAEHEAFVKVVERGSFAGAADALGRPRAMVSSMRP
jgi:hypothetical protein